MLDELPSLEFAATAVAVVLTLRALVLWRKVGLVRGPARVESARARDLIGVAILAVALLYAVRVNRASTWFLAAIGLAIAAQLLGFFLRSTAKSAPLASAPPSPSAPTLDVDEEEDLTICPMCGHGTLIELEDPTPLLGGLSALTPVAAAICPACGALCGNVEDPSKVPIGAAHGTALRRGPSSADQEGLEEPAEHEG